MGLFDDLAKQVTGMLGDSGAAGGAEAEQGPMVGGLAELVQGSGGLGGLLSAFQQQGLGDTAQSWVGSGENRPISPQQIERVLGFGPIQQFAARFGLTPEQASGQIAALLPGVIDKLTPEGRLPDNALLQQGLELLKSRFQSGMGSRESDGRP